MPSSRRREAVSLERIDRLVSFFLFAPDGGHRLGWAGGIFLAVVLTGAGLSAESGLGTFRGSGGLWENFRIEDVATPEAFARDPATVQRFYDQRRRQHDARDHAVARAKSPAGRTISTTAAMR